MATRQDTFNDRSGTTLGGSTMTDGVGHWTAVSGNGSIVTSSHGGNIVVVDDGGSFGGGTFEAYDDTAPDSATQYVQITTHWVYRDIRVCARYVDTNNYYYIQAVLGGNIELRKRTSGTDSSALATYTGGVTAGDTIGLDCSGTTLKIYKNGAYTGTSATDSSITTGKWGVRLTEVYDTSIDQFDVTYTADAAPAKGFPFPPRYPRFSSLLRR